LPVDERYPRLNLTPEQLKERTEDAIAAMAAEEAERQPMLAVWEDVHWADPSSLDLLGRLIRPEFSPPWPARSYVRPLPLNRLERPQIMISELDIWRAPAEISSEAPLFPVGAVRLG
jgi:hypothetical protein